jgi:5'-deoxynucleotidase YfbR-like HD superfamily hydrolase
MKGIMMRTPIDKLMDAQYIKRWAICGTALENNLATHSFNVAMLAMEIANRMPDVKRRHPESLICYYALIHDVGEVYTGDIPTPTKAKMLQAGLDINNFDMDAVMENHPSEEIKSIIKAADLIDNYLFILEHGIGSRARSAQIEVFGRLIDYSSRVPPILGKAMMDTLNYVMRRMSDVIQEGRRVEEANKAELERDGTVRDINIVGGKS